MINLSWPIDTHFRLSVIVYRMDTFDRQTARNGHLPEQVLQTGIGSAGG